MHRQRDGRCEPTDGLGGTGRVEVAGAEVRAPPPHRQRGEVDRALGGDVVEPGEQAGVTGDVDAQPVALQKVPHRVGLRAVGEPGPPPVPGVVGRCAGDAQPVEDTGLPHGELGHPGDAAAAEPVAGARGHHDLHRARQPAQRGEVQVVGVQVGDQDQVGSGGPLRVDGRRGAAQRPDRGPQHRVGQDGAPADPQPQGAVAEEGRLRQVHTVEYPLRRCRGPDRPRSAAPPARGSPGAACTRRRSGARRRRRRRARPARRRGPPAWTRCARRRR